MLLFYYQLDWFLMVKYSLLPPGRSVKCCDQHVCVCVCLSHMLPVAVAQSSDDDNAMQCVLPTSCFHIMDQIGQNQRGQI